MKARSLAGGMGSTGGRLRVPRSQPAAAFQPRRQTDRDRSSGSDMVDVVEMRPDARPIGETDRLCVRSALAGFQPRRQDTGDRLPRAATSDSGISSNVVSFRQGLRPARGIWLRSLLTHDGNILATGGERWSASVSGMPLRDARLAAAIEHDQPDHGDRFSTRTTKTIITASAQTGRAHSYLWNVKDRGQARAGDSVPALA